MHENITIICNISVFIVLALNEGLLTFKLRDK